MANLQQMTDTQLHSRLNLTLRTYQDLSEQGLPKGENFQGPWAQKLLGTAMHIKEIRLELGRRAMAQVLQSMDPITLGYWQSMASTEKEQDVAMYIVKMISDHDWVRDQYEHLLEFNTDDIG